MKKIKTVICITSKLNYFIEGMVYNVIHETPFTYEIHIDGIPHFIDREYFIEL